jgi:hypothetical protein
MTIPNYTVSKTSFIKFEQCAKAFFLYKNHPWLKDKLSTDKKLTFNRGHQVGNLAQQLFPGGVDVSLETKNSEEAVKRTHELIAAGIETIYEATFVFEKVLIMVDILHFEDGRYTAYEVKSSLKVSETYLLDGCLQYYVLKNCLSAFEDFFLVTLNGDYVLKDELQVRQLFKKRNIKKEGEKNLSFFSERIKEANLTLEKNVIPDISVGKQCFKPYQCDFFGSCWKNMNGDKSIFNVPLISKEQLFEWNSVGIKNIDEINDGLIGNEKTLRIKRAFETGRPMIDGEQISQILSKVKFPMAALDMEIWSCAVPEIQGTKPFQQIPFLFSITSKDTSSFYLSTHQSDDRKRFAEELIAQTQAYDSLLVYDKTMEEQVVNNLSDLYPDLAMELMPIKNKMIDLSGIFKNFYYYDAAFKNNFSLKVISEALGLDVRFDKIKSGLEAMNFYERLRAEKNEVECQLIKDDLLSYCGSDTRATYLLFEFLQQVQNEKTSNS